MVSLERSALVRKCSALTTCKESLDSVFALVDGKAVDGWLLVLLTVMDDRFCPNKLITGGCHHKSTDVSLYAMMNIILLIARETVVDLL